MIETINLSKKYKPKRGVPVTAINDVSLKFPDRGMVFLLGKSGSGKSTLLNLLGGLDRYDGGEMHLLREYRQRIFHSSILILTVIHMSVLYFRNITFLTSLLSEQILLWRLSFRENARQTSRLIQFCARWILKDMEADVLTSFPEDRSSAWRLPVLLSRIRQ